MGLRSLQPVFCVTLVVGESGTMNRRPRKEFATGARTLRGGKNNYTAKTLCGNWVEAQFDPEFEDLARESKFDPKYTSTSANDQKEGIGIVPPEFGGSRFNELSPFSRRWVRRFNGWEWGGRCLNEMH